MVNVVPEQEDHLEGCCLEISQEEATQDEDLPPTEGGVEGD